MGHDHVIATTGGAAEAALLAGALAHALAGGGAHVDARAAVASLDWKAAGTRPPGSPHSVYQIVNHMQFWHEWVLKWLDGRRPRTPRHAAGSWPGTVAPRNRGEWVAARRRFAASLDDLARRAREPGPLARNGTRSRLEMIQTIAAHTSYHAGQVVLVRRLLGAWPPPSGGLTW